MRVNRGSLVKPIKKIKNWIRVTTTYAVLLSLIIYPMELIALDGDTTRTIGGIINQFGQQMQQLQSLQYDNQAQMASLARAQQLMAANAPSSVISSRYFPKCALPPDNQLPPPNVCENLQTQADIVLAQQMTFLGQQQTIFLDIMLNGTGDSSPNNAGIACMDEALKRHAQLFTSKMNSLESYRTKYNKEKQIIKKNLQPLLDKMDDLHYEVAGGDPKNEKQKSFNFEKLFTGTACQGIVDATHYISKKGIRGVRDALTTPTPDSNGKSLYGNASNLLSDKDKLKAQVEVQIQRLVKLVNTYGPGEFDIKDGYLDRGGETVFYEMGLAVARQQDILTKRHKQIKDQLAKDFPGYELPALDRHFMTNVQQFATEAKDYFRKKMVHDCVTMKDQTGVGLTNQQVLSLLDFPGNSNSPTVKNYKTELDGILSRNSFIEDKLNQIKALDQKYGNDVILKGSFATLKGNTPKTPYAVYLSIVNQCSKSNGPLEGTNAFSTKEGARDARSGMEKVKEGERLVNEIKNLGSHFTTDLAKEIRERTLNCGGGINQTAASCNTKTLTPESIGFCLDNAVKCATRVKSCQSLAQKHIEDRVTQIKNVAGTYNQNVLAFTAETERTLNVLKTQVFQDMAVFAAQFPEVNIPLPEDLFVKLPEKVMSPYDIDLLGDVTGKKKFSFMDDLSDNIGKLMETIQKVNDDIQSVGKAGGYVDKTRKKLKENQRKWDDFRTLCSDKIAEIDMNQKHMKEEAKREQEELQKKMFEEINDKKRYCTKYHSLNRPHPGPGCDQEIQSLIDGLDDVAIAIKDPDQVLYNLNSYKTICDKINNEKDENEDDAIKQLSLPKLCLNNDYSFEALKKGLIKKLLAMAPEGVSKQEILDYLNEGTETEPNKDTAKADKNKPSKKKKLFSGFDKLNKKNGSDDDEDELTLTGEYYFDQKLKGLKDFFMQAKSHADQDQTLSSKEFHTKEINNYDKSGDISDEKIKKDLKDLQEKIDHINDGATTTPNNLIIYNNVKELINEANKAFEADNLEKLNLKLSSIASALKDDPMKPEIHTMSSDLAKNIQKRVTNKDTLNDKNDAKEKFVKMLKPGDKDACAILQREIVVDLAQTCLKKKDDPLSCYKEKEKEAFVDGEGVSLASRNLNVQLQNYMLLPLEPPFSEVWEGMGENLHGTCIGEDDMQRGFMNDSQRGFSTPIDQWGAQTHGR